MRWFDDSCHFPVSWLVHSISSSDTVDVHRRKWAAALKESTDISQCIIRTQGSQPKWPFWVSYLSLNQVVSLCADMFEEIQDTDCAFVLDLLQHAVNDDVRSCAANPCTVEQSISQNEQRHICKHKNPALSLTFLRPSSWEWLLYLQCTRTGPMSVVRAEDERLMKVRTGRVYSGTPMSGHWV